MFYYTYCCMHTKNTSSNFSTLTTYIKALYSHAQKQGEKFTLELKNVLEWDEPAIFLTIKKIGKEIVGQGNDYQQLTFHLYYPRSIIDRIDEQSITIDDLLFDVSKIQLQYEKRTSTWASVNTTQHLESLYMKDDSSTPNATHHNTYMQYIDDMMAETT